MTCEAVAEETQAGTPYAPGCRFPQNTVSTQGYLTAKQLQTAVGNEFNRGESADNTHGRICIPRLQKERIEVMERETSQKRFPKSSDS